MFFNIFPWPLRLGYPAWTPVIFWLALFSPGVSFHISTTLIRMSWVEASAETRPTRMDESILTLNLAIEHALAGNPELGGN